MKYLLMMLVLFSHDVFALNLIPEQKQVKKIAYNIGKSNCVQDQCFGKTLQAIAWQESSFGLNNKPKSKTTTKYFYEYLGDIFEVQEKNVIKIKNEMFIMHKILPYVSIKRKVYSSSKTSIIKGQALGAFQIKLSTAKYTIERMRLQKYYKYLIDDHSLKMKLVHDDKFSAIIAVNYLKMHYISGLKTNHPNPLHLTISRYNGGNNNTEYINLITSKMQRLNG